MRKNPSPLKTILTVIILGATLLLVPGPTGAQNPSSPANRVCPDPEAPCHHPRKKFDDWELSFKMARRLKRGGTDVSAPFYAILLDTYRSGQEDDCDGGEYISKVERARQQAQQMFPGRKVFASYNCPNMSAVNYEFDGRYDAQREQLLIEHFLAVYAGETLADAQALLGETKARFPRAVIKKMQVIYDRSTELQ